MGRPNPENLVMWKPGQSGNPAGRKKKPITAAYQRALALELPEGAKTPEAMRAVLERMLDKGATVADVVALAQIAKAARGDTRAIAEVTDRVEGKAIATQVIEGGNFPALLAAAGNGGFAPMPETNPPAEEGKPDGDEQPSGG